jgi:dTDP-4-dehydrorhamnose reductase
MANQTTRRVKVLVTGASGMLGSDLCALWSGAHEIAPYTRDELDVRDREAVRRVVGEEKPDVIVHTAAATNVDQCEREPDWAYAVNTVGTWNVALAAADIDACIAYVSTCGVFDGLKGAPYTEVDQPHPLTHYHRSKREGEGIVATICRKHFIVRPGWLFGGMPTHRRNFVANRLREASGKSEIVSAKDKFGSPTYTVDFAATLMRLIDAEAYGLYHLTNVGFASRYEYVREIIDVLGLPSTVRAVDSGFFPRSAPVPSCEALDNMYLRLQGFGTMRPWQEALRDYIATHFAAAMVQTA